MIVGNDVVDRDRAGVPSSAFLARVLGAEERALAAQSSDLPALVWRLWAAKETAYKVLARDDWELPFAHRRFSVDLAAAVVSHERGRVTIRFAEEGPALTCWGWQGTGDAISRLATLEEAEAGGGELTPREGAGDRGSRAVRLLAKRALAETFDVDPAALEIVRPVRDRNLVGPPEVWLRGAPLSTVSLSLAHDGRYVACAIGFQSLVTPKR